MKYIPLALTVLLVGCSDALVSEDSLQADVVAANSIEAPAIPLLSLEASATTAKVQVIHNAPQRAARFVDVYVDGALALDNFKFRKATPFIDLPTNVSVAIAPASSNSVADALATFEFELEAGNYYVVTAAGLLGDDPAFSLFPYAPGRSGSGSDLVSILAFHGVPDAPTVDVVARNVATLVDDFSFGEYQGYVDVPAARYILDVTLPDQSATVASFKANLKGLEGGAAVVLATGFLTSDETNFGLLAVLADGSTQRLFRARDHK